jgi:hypothetical protein
MWAIVELLGSLGKEWLVGKVEVKKAETNARIEHASKRIDAEVNWDTAMAQGAATSWKDEWWTILVSIPLVLVFFEYTRPAVHAGFVALEAMPPWYIYLTSVAFAAAFGVRKVIESVERLIKMKRP